MCLSNEEWEETIAEAHGWRSDRPRISQADVKEKEMATRSNNIHGSDEKVRPMVEEKKVVPMTPEPLDKRMGKAKPIDMDKIAEGLGIVEAEILKKDPISQKLPEVLDQVAKEMRARNIQKLTGDPDFDEMLARCIETMDTKGQEYTAGSKDRLANFKGVAADVDMPMEKVWYTFFNKHLRAIQSYIKNGCEVKSNEGIDGRIMDCIVYLLLFYKMTNEIGRTKHGVIS